MSEWRDRESAPKDGTVFFGQGDNDAHPLAIYWQTYDPDDAEEVGEPGFWAYAEELIADVAGAAEFRWWMPIPPLPTPPEETTP